MTLKSSDHHDLPCNYCGARSAFSRYVDGHGFCHKCRKWEASASHTPTNPEPRQRESRLMMGGVVSAIEDRKITRATAEKYSVTCEKTTNGEILYHWYPAYSVKTGEVVAAKKRDCDAKRRGGSAPFKWTGDRQEVGMFGQQTCKGGGKYITICEGELDAMSASQMFENKFDFVSPLDGTGSIVQDVKSNLEFLEGYQNIVLCLDMDEAGQDAMHKIKDLFSPNKVKMVSLPEKDANKMLESGQASAFVKAWWEAKPYQPDGIVSVKDTWESILTFRDTPSVDYPWPCLNEMLMGQRTQEIVVWGAPTGLGKSTVMRELQDSLIHTIPKNERVGCLMLEESIAKTTLGWMSFKANKPLHKELKNLSDEELRRYWEEATDGNRYVLLDHQGWQNNLDTLKARIRYMVRAMDCRWVILDHLHIALSSIEGASGDWSGIDELMTQLRSIVHELDIGMHLVSHISGDLKFRGSQGIAQLADAAIFLDRDKHAEGEMANITKVIVDKNRFAGDVGTAGYLRYNSETGRMLECEAPDAPPPPEEF